MIIDCDDCAMANSVACGDCVVTVVLGAIGPRTLELDDDEAVALERLADAGLVAPLRLVPRRRHDTSAAG